MSERFTPARAAGEHGQFGVYLHIPFCAKRCDYCAFATWTDRHHLMADYAAACRREIATASLPAATSVFVGGGTPSLLPADLLASILADVALAPGAEVTVECNPDDITVARLEAYRAAGVNRISMGVQSTVPHVLQALGRTHGPASVRAAAGAVGEAGFTSYNVDLVYGAVGESTDDWAHSVADVLALEPRPSHVSAYGLTVEAGTPLAADAARHPDDDDLAAKYELADDLLGAAGLANYEISNWAEPGHECRHNALYWSQGDYRGIGCAAHSHAGGRRWWNLRTPERYIAAVEADTSAEGGGETLDAETRAREGLQLALRTRAGVPRGALDERDPDLEGLVEVCGDRLVLTRRGRLLANEVAMRLQPGVPA